MNKIKTAFVFFAVCLFPIFSNINADTRSIEQRLSGILDSRTASELVQRKEILRQKYGASNMAPEIQPVSALSDKMSEFLSKKKPAFLGEFISLYKKEGPYSPDVSMILRHISGLEGIEYFSHGNKSMRTLYVKSHAVKEVINSNGREYERIDDPFDADFDGLELLVRHVDQTFGDFIYRYNYLKDDNDIGMVCTNIQKMTHSDIRLISLPAEAMVVSMSFHDLDDYVLIYCSIRAKFPIIPFVGNKIKRSFSARLTAIYNWFMNEYRINEKVDDYYIKLKSGEKEE